MAKGNNPSACRLLAALVPEPLSQAASARGHSPVRHPQSPKSSPLKLREHPFRVLVQQQVSPYSWHP